MMLKKAKYGGKCPQLSLITAEMLSHGERKVLEQRELCHLADEHSMDRKKNENSDNQFKWPALEYPGEDPQKVGYCPSKTIQKKKANCFFLNVN